MIEVSKSSLRRCLKTLSRTRTHDRQRDESVLAMGTDRILGEEAKLYSCQYASSVLHEVEK